MEEEMEMTGAFFEEASTNLATVLERVVEGKTITITRGGVPVARLAPVRSVKPGFLTKKSWKACVRFGNG